MSRIADSYEYAERAAIRYLNGRFGDIEANQLALIDIREREERDRLKEEKDAQAVAEKELPRRAEPPRISSKNDELLKERAIVRAAFLAANEPEKSEYQAKYFELCRQIINSKG